MPKFPTFPTLYDEVLQISITKLKEWDYLKSEKVKTGIITWRINGEKTASISITVNTNDRPYIELNYESNGEPRKYKVWLVSVPSNLGIGKIWYFVCPQTQKRCRKLYLVSGYFLHRDAFNGCMYDSQTKSKKGRLIDRYFGSYFSLDGLYAELYSKHFKTHYNGKPTKRYLSLLNKISQAERISIEDVERLMVS